MIKQPGFIGFKALDVSSASFAGKFTDSNHLSRLSQDSPTMYDREIQSLYSQTYLRSNDFEQMLGQSDIFYIDGDSWTSEIAAPYEPNVLVEIPSDTASSINALGVDGHPFTLVFRRKFQLNAVITANKMYGDALTVVSEPRPWNSAWAIDVILTGENVTKTSVAQSRYILEGTEYQQIDFITGEFDQELDGIDMQGRKIKLMHTMAAGYALEHSITKWADQRTLRDEKGNIKDIIAYTQYRINEMGKEEVIGVRWEPYAERKCREKMMDLRLNRTFWGQGGQSQARGGRQEVRKHMQGVYHKMKNYGQYVDFNRGQFSGNLLRQTFGDLFYRRIEIADRRVKLYTNEAGMELFRQANLDDLKASGLTIIADERFIKGKGQNMMADYGFNMMFSMETGTVEVVHLKQLDLPEDFQSFSVNRKSPPIFYVFDISNPDGGLQNNIREVRKKGAPSMTYGYEHGRQHHLGSAYSMGMESGSKFPGYNMWFDDQFDIFIENLDRTVVIEQKPQI